LEGLEMHRFNKTLTLSGVFKNKKSKKITIALMLMAVLLAFQAVFQPLATYAQSPGNPAMDQVYNRTDAPVASGAANRSWVWGPTRLSIHLEPYKESPDGRRFVVYYDKARMEMNNPNASTVTNGLLVKEMISGNIQTGDNSFVTFRPAEQPLAGDPATTNWDAPTYASLRGVASLNNDNRSQHRVNQFVNERINRLGQVSGDNLGQYYNVRYMHYDSILGHNVADVFMRYFEQRGKVLENGRLVDGKILDWMFAVGLPVTEPYWSKVRVNGVEKDVLVQAFERRVLTYTPSNPEAWKVEMGNAGQHYRGWRYNNFGEDMALQNHTPAPAINVTTSGPVTVNAGGVAQKAVSVRSINGFNGYVSLRVEGLSRGLNASFHHNDLYLPANGTATTTLNLRADANAALGTANLNIIASDGAHRAAVNSAVKVAGAFSVSTTGNFTANIGGMPIQKPVVIRSIDGFSGNVDLKLEGLTRGLKATFSQNRVFVPANGTVTVNLNVVAEADASRSTANLNIIASNGGVQATTRVSVNVAYSGGVFDIGATPNNVVLTQGGKPVQVRIGIRSFDGFNGRVNLSVEGMSNGLKASGMAKYTDLGIDDTDTEFLTLDPSKAAAGYQLLTISGNSNGKSDSTVVAVTINPAPGAPVGNFSVTTVSSVTLKAGSSAGVPIPVYLHSVGGFSGPVTLSATGGNKNGLFLSFDPATVYVSNNGSSSTLSLSIPKAATAESFTLVISATSGNRVASTPLVVNIIPA
jgi:hypothetical protein